MNALVVVFELLAALGIAWVVMTIYHTLNADSGQGHSLGEALRNLMKQRWGRVRFVLLPLSLLFLMVAGFVFPAVVSLSLFGIAVILIGLGLWRQDKKDAEGHGIPEPSGEFESQLLKRLDRLTDVLDRPVEAGSGVRAAQGTQAGGGEIDTSSLTAAVEEQTRAIRAIDASHDSVDFGFPLFLFVAFPLLLITYTFSDFREDSTYRSSVRQCAGEVLREGTFSSSDVRTMLGKAKAGNGGRKEVLDFLDQASEDESKTKAYRNDADYLHTAIFFSGSGVGRFAYSLWVDMFGCD